jgi:ribonucleoside-diphosphate reductase alpha chain
MAQSIVDYIFRRLALDYMPFEARAGLGIYTAEERARQLETGSYAPADDDTEDFESLAQSAPVTQSQKHASTKTDVAIHSSTELLESLLGASADAPLCMSCGTKMQRAGSCFLCEGCGSTSGCS